MVALMPSYLRFSVRRGPELSGNLCLSLFRCWDQTDEYWPMKSASIVPDMFRNLERSRSLDPDCLVSLSRVCAHVRVLQG